MIFRSESGFLVDHEIAISQSVSLLSLSCKDGLFALFEPYFRIACDNRRRKVFSITFSLVLGKGNIVK